MIYLIRGVINERWMVSGTQLASAKTQTEKAPEVAAVDVGEPVRKGQFVVGMSVYLFYLFITSRDMQW